MFQNKMKRHPKIGFYEPYSLITSCIPAHLSSGSRQGKLHAATFKYEFFTEKMYKNRVSGQNGI